MNAITRKILFVDDDLNLLSGLKRQNRGKFEIVVAPGCRAALEIIQQQGPFAVVVTDYSMPEINGVQLCQAITHMAPETVKVMLTCWTDLNIAVSALHEGRIYRFLNKPCPPELLEATLHDCLEQYRLVYRERLLMNELRQSNLELSQLNRELEQARSEAEHANQSKSRFLAQISHEVRTPMTSILGFADLMMYEHLDAAEQQHALRTIRKNGDYLLELLNDILDLSKIEAGKLEVQAVDCSVVQVLSDIASLMRVRAKSKNLSLLIDYETAIPERIHTDPMRLRQILMNLVGNAIKFTESGQIRVLTRLRTDGPEPMIQFDVIDTGIGIDHEQAPLLFRPFAQATCTTAEKFGGTGLGLTISRKLASLLGGDITFTSEPGRGSTFTATIQTGSLAGTGMWQHPSESLIEPMGGSSQDDADPHPLAGSRILLADDGPDNRKLIQLLLQRAGANVTAVENGLQAVQTVQAGNTFDLVLMDMQMPMMDGYEATRQLRADGYGGQIVALTANAMAADRAHCLEAGCSDFVTKPISRRKLLCKLSDLLRPATAPG